VPGEPPAGAGAGGRQLNNCVTELLNVTQREARRRAEWRFQNPRHGWVFVRTVGRVRAGGELTVAVEATGPAPVELAPAPLSQPAAGPLLLAHEPGRETSREAMRFLPPGEYLVRARTVGAGRLERLVVRAIPELVFCKFQYDPHIAPHGPYDRAFLERHLATNVNCIVGSGAPEHRELVRQWKQQGKRWLVECGVPGLDGRTPLTAEQAYAYWTGNAGFADPLLDGVVADEFLGNRPGMKYPEWTEAVRRLRAAPAWRGKFFYPYCTAIYRDPVSAEFLRVVLAAGYPFAWEVYLQEPPDEAAARRQLETKLAAEMERWRATLPQCERQMVLCLGYMSLPATETLNINPQVDYKVWMDLQFHHVATHPAFAGLYGLMEYTCGYADEETVRWAARLYRHYGIEGQTAPLSPALGFTYRLDHLENPDFAAGTRGWAVQAAEPDSVAARTHPGYGWLQGRYPRTPLGDTFLWMRRSARQPNRVSQPIRRLQPGRLYSLKLVTADYQELQRGNSVPQRHAVSLTLEGVTPIPEKSFQHTQASNYAHTLGAFTDRNPLWMNYHFRLFRAQGRTAKLILSDWASPDSPGGPAGQELMCNFLEVQPYFEP